MSINNILLSAAWNLLKKAMLQAFVLLGYLLVYFILFYVGWGYSLMILLLNSIFAILYVLAWPKDSVDFFRGMVQILAVFFRAIKSRTGKNKVTMPEAKQKLQDALTAFFLTLGGPPTEKNDKGKLVMKALLAYLHSGATLADAKAIVEKASKKKAALRYDHLHIKEYISFPRALVFYNTGGARETFEYSIPL